MPRACSSARSCFSRSSSWEYRLAEAAQLNARLSLVLAGLLAVLAGLYGFTDRFERPAGVAVGLACAAGTVFLLAARLSYFSGVGEFVVPVIQAITDLL